MGVRNDLGVRTEEHLLGVLAPKNTFWVFSSMAIPNRQLRSRRLCGALRTRRLKLDRRSESSN